MRSFVRGFAAVMVLVVFGALAPLAITPATAQAAATDVVINEFLAVSQNGLVDNTGSAEDWIELRNTTGSTVDLGGWVLADASSAFEQASR